MPSNAARMLRSVSSLTHDPIGSERAHRLIHRGHCRADSRGSAPVPKYAGKFRAYSRLSGQPKVNNAIRSRVSDAALVDDIVQQTLMAVESHIASYGGLAHFRTWLYAVARNDRS